MQWLNATRFGHDNGLLGLNTLLHLQLYQYYTCIAFTLLIYNLLFTLEKERVYVWKQSKKLPFYMFLVLRYYPFITLTVGFNLRYFTQIPDSSGHGYDLFLSSLGCRLAFLRLSLGPVITVISGVILMLRVNAVYERDRRVKWFLFVIYLSQIMTNVWIIFDDSPERGVGLILFHERCPTVDEVTQNDPRAILPLFITAIAFDFVIFILTLRKGLQSRALGGAGSTILQAVVQGGNIYFIVLLVVNLTNTILIVFAMQDFSHTSNSIFPWIGAFIGNMNMQLAAVITSIIVSNLFMDLREAAHRSQQGSGLSRTTGASIGQWACASRNNTIFTTQPHTALTTNNLGFKSPANPRRSRVSEDFGVVLLYWASAESEDDYKSDDWELVARTSTSSQYP